MCSSSFLVVSVALPSSFPLSEDFSGCCQLLSISLLLCSSAHLEMAGLGLKTESRVHSVLAPICSCICVLSVVFPDV